MVTVTLNPAIDQAVMIPRFRANAVNRVMGERRTAGGKGINVATFLADYGVPVVVTGFLGGRMRDCLRLTSRPRKSRIGWCGLMGRRG